jgi:hypothetical protein
MTNTIWTTLYRVSHKEKWILWEVTLLAILSKKVHVRVFIPNGFRDRAISLYSSNIFNKEEILRNLLFKLWSWHSLPSIIYFENFPSKSVHFATRVMTWHLARLSAFWHTTVLLYCETALRKPFGIGHMYIYTFLLRMTHTTTSHNIDISSWDVLYFKCKMQMSGEEEVNSYLDFVKNKSLTKN